MLGFEDGIPSSTKRVRRREGGFSGRVGEEDLDSPFAMAHNRGERGCAALQRGSERTGSRSRVRWFARPESKGRGNAGLTGSNVKRLAQTGPNTQTFDQR